ncbi:MAG: UbiD family decarboxylase, partial [Deltaproteobacteria bacterium]|nr:UbiD family decarboxylase [Deltaproteobacteria bacterium]
MAKVPVGVDELAVSGGIDGEPIELVRCRTVDLEVPAHAEIVVEGEMSTEFLEPEAPFGEYCGYMGDRVLNPVIQVTGITHRRDAIYLTITSQFPPSESSKIRQVAYEHVYLKHLKYDCNIPDIRAVAIHESSGSWQYLVIQLRRTHGAQPWQALHAAVAFDPTIGKIIIVVDEDIDPWDPDSVNWALSFRMMPHRDLRVIRGKATMLDHSAAPPGQISHVGLTFPDLEGTSAVLMDATRKWGYPPVSLPGREFMEAALKIWQEEGLPALQLKAPWWGYELGYWPDEFRQEAELALKGEHYRTGEKLQRQRRYGASLFDPDRGEHREGR